MSRTPDSYGMSQWTAINGPSVPDDSISTSPSPSPVTQVTTTSTDTDTDMNSPVGRMESAYHTKRPFYDAVRDAAMMNGQPCGTTRDASPRALSAPHGIAKNLDYSSSRIGAYSTTAPVCEEYSTKLLGGMTKEDRKRTRAENSEIRRQLLASSFREYVLVDRSCESAIRGQPNTQTAVFVDRLVALARTMPKRATYDTDTFHTNGARTLVPVLVGEGRDLRLILKPLFSVLEDGNKIRIPRQRRPSGEPPSSKRARLKANQDRWREERFLIPHALKEFEERNPDLVAIWRRTDWSTGEEMKDAVASEPVSL